MLEPSLVNGFLSVLVAEARKILAKNKRTSRHFSTEAVSNAGRITAVKIFFFFFFLNGVYSGNTIWTVSASPGKSFDPLLSF